MRAPSLCKTEHLLIKGGRVGNAQTRLNNCCSLANHTLHFPAMQRDLVWIKEKSRWGCSACMWVFSAPKVLVQGSLDDMLSKFEEERQQEFLRHVCSDQPKSNREKS